MRGLKVGVLTIATIAAGLPGLKAARASADHLDTGDDIPSFSLKAINPEVLASPGMGGQVRIDDFVGADAKDKKQALLLTFFATYCEPCKKEMPFLALLYETYRDKGLQIVAVSIDKEADKVDLARSLAKQNRVNYPVLSDHFNIVARRYQVSRLPCLYLVSAAGKVLLADSGYSGDASQRLLDETRKALGIPTSDPLPEAISTYLKVHPAPAQSQMVAVPAAPPGAIPAANRTAP